MDIYATFQGGDRCNGQGGCELSEQAPTEEIVERLDLGQRATEHGGLHCAQLELQVVQYIETSSSAQVLRYHGTYFIISIDSFCGSYAKERSTLDDTNVHTHKKVHVTQAAQSREILQQGHLAISVVERNT